MSAPSNASNIFSPRRNELSSTYIVQDRHNQEEIVRLTVQDQLFTAAMGGVLGKQEGSAQFRKVLDIGCGTGGWIIETALAHPEMSLVGIDISQKMIDYANEQAETRGVSEQVRFQVTDALTLPGIPDASFDLVNLRFGSSYLRTWDWPRIMREMVRVARPGGTIQLVDSEVIQPGSSTALIQLSEMFLCALHRSNHIFAQNAAGIIPHLQDFLTEQRCQDIQVENHTIKYQAGTAAGEAFYQDAMYVFRTVRPFIQKWGCITKDYDTLYQQMLIDIQQPDFHASINFSTVWGCTPEKPV